MKYENSAMNWLVEKAKIVYEDTYFSETVGSKVKSTTYALEAKLPNRIISQLREYFKNGGKLNKIEEDDYCLIDNIKIGGEYRSEQNRVCFYRTIVERII